MVSQRAINKTAVQEEEYFGDIFSDERFLLGGLDPDDLLTDVMSANQEAWDVLDIADQDWADCQTDGYLEW
ncbi:MAG: hypothetical protein OEM38_10855 [Gammaproteobacteria bacterium]|nr:hypothetical protein [Gammaproteobacteria bacterium]